MPITLTPDAERVVTAHVDSGLFETPDEVVREALRALGDRLDHDAKRADLRREIDHAIEQADRGELKPFTQEAVDGIMARVRAKLAAKKTGGAAWSAAVYTSAADRDLEDIADYVAIRDEWAAARLLTRIRERADFYAAMPDLGIPRDDLRPGTRCYVVGRYVTFYRPAAGTIQVLRVLHGSRDVDAVMRDYDPDA